MTVKIDVFNPYAKVFDDVGVSHVLDHTTSYKYPFLHILAARWYSAVQADRTGLSKTVYQPDQCTGDVLLTVDHFLPLLNNYWGDETKLKSMRQRIIVSSCLPEDSGIFKKLAMNIFMSARSGSYNTAPGFSYEFFQNDRNNPIPIIPMGCGEEWLPVVNHREKIVFLDEPHETLLQKLENTADIRVALFDHALKTSEILNKMGFRIISFSRDSAPVAREVYRNHPFIETIDIGNWIPFTDLVNHYAKASLFFSFFTETHGYPIYENMQMGNGVITYAETFDPTRLKQMQQGVILSVYSSPRTCADLVNEYYERYQESNLRPHIRQAANLAYSTETYFDRLRRSSNFMRLLL